SQGRKDLSDLIPLWKSLVTSRGSLPRMPARRPSAKARPGPVRGPVLAAEPHRPVVREAAVETFSKRASGRPRAWTDRCHGCASRGRQNPLRGCVLRITAGTAVAQRVVHLLPLHLRKAAAVRAQRLGPDSFCFSSIFFSSFLKSSRWRRESRS